ncbi:MAG: hypothetical protein GY931_06840 [Maribacter sp.]|nr:hypothetical protein [Maribacter sp.]
MVVIEISRMEGKEHIAEPKVALSNEVTRAENLSELGQLLDTYVYDLERDLFENDTVDKYYFLEIGLILHVHDYRNLIDLETGFFPGYYSFYDLDGRHIKTVSKPPVSTAIFSLSLPSEVRESDKYSICKKPSFLALTNDTPSQSDFLPSHFNKKTLDSLNA